MWGAVTTISLGYLINNTPHRHDSSYSLFNSCDFTKLLPQINHCSASLLQAIQKCVPHNLQPTCKCNLLGQITSLHWLIFFSCCCFILLSFKNLSLPYEEVKGHFHAILALLTSAECGNAISIQRRRKLMSIGKAIMTTPTEGMARNHKMCHYCVYTYTCALF